MDLRKEEVSSKQVALNLWTWLIMDWRIKGILRIWSYIVAIRWLQWWRTWDICLIWVLEKKENGWLKNLGTLNGNFVKERGDFPFCVFPELWVGKDGRCIRVGRYSSMKSSPSRKSLQWWSRKFKKKLTEWITWMLKQWRLCWRWKGTCLPSPTMSQVTLPPSSCCRGAT